MKKFMIAVCAFATICTVSCKKETVSPTSRILKKTVMSGGGDKRPGSTYD